MFFKESLFKILNSYLVFVSTLFKSEYVANKFKMLDKGNKAVILDKKDYFDISR